MKALSFVIHLFVILGLVQHIMSEIPGCETGSADDTILNCSYSNITQFPGISDIPADVSVIDLSHNCIKRIEHINISNPFTLKILNLSRNCIKSVEYDSFTSLTHLEKLDLSYNQLLGSALIVKLTKFEVKFKKIKWISFRSNPLGLIKRMTFTSHGYMTLEHLDLSHCSITTLEHLALDNLPRLKVLLLKYNELTVLDSSSFVGLMELEFLDLSYNKITVLEDVPTLMSLTNLNLNNNKLKKIQDQALSSAPALQTLSIQNNLLRYLTHLSVPWDNVEDILLEGNPWHCDCNLKWVKNFDSVQDHLSRLNLICAYPARLRGKNIKDVSAGELRCPRSLAGFIAILLAALTIVLVFGAVIAIIYSNRKTLRCLSGRSGSYIAVYQNEQDGNDAEVTISDQRALVNDKEIYA